MSLAVIDKDLCSGLLARDLEADGLVKAMLEGRAGTQVRLDSGDAPSAIPPLRGQAACD